MLASANKNFNLSVSTGILSAIIVTTILFVALPLLSTMQARAKKTIRATSILISSRRPPPPPELDRDKKIERLERKVKQSQKKQTTKTARPRIDLPRVSLAGGMNLAGTIKISGISQRSFNISRSAFSTAFNLTEVDQPPRVLRALDPQYPFLAKRQGIEGRIILRFVVNEEGDVLEPEVSSVEPSEIAGVFDEAALEAVLRYKFRPAIKDGEPVSCIVKLPISFTLR